MLMINQLVGFGVGGTGYAAGSISSYYKVAGLGSTTSSSTLTSGSFTGTAGRLLVIIVAADNNGTNGASSFAGVSLGSGGKGLATVFESVYDPGAAAAGAGLAIYTVEQTVSGSNTVTASFSPATTSKAMMVWELWHTGGAPLSAVASTTAGATSAAPSVTQGSVLAGDLLVGALSQEARTIGTPDGAWGTSLGVEYYYSTADTGTAGTSIALESQLRTASADGSYTYAPTLGVSRDHIAGIVAIRAAS